jgi:arsenite-transporting ATPase
VPRRGRAASVAVPRTATDGAPADVTGGPGVRVLLFTGKGGVGKTTLAGATAVALAARGRKTLVVSTDPAHSLADAFATPLTAVPTEVHTGVHAAQVDTRGLLDTAWQDLRAELRQVLTGLGVDALEAEELTILPGVDEVLALTEVQRLAALGRWDTVVVDCGPTAETLRLLALPQALRGYLDRLAAPPGRLVLGGHRRGNPLGSLRRLAAHLESLRRLLTDPSVTTVRLVLTPERVVLAEARRTLSALALRGIGVDGLVVNRVLPAPRFRRGPAARWMRTRRAEQDKVLGELAAEGQDTRLVMHRAREPVGADALRDIARELYGDTDPLAATAAPPVPPLWVSETGSGYRLTVSMPLRPESVVDLSRVDDELAITVDGFRQLIALPESLRPCTISGAETSVQGLLVFLTPDGRDR